MLVSLLSGCAPEKVHNQPKAEMGILDLTPYELEDTLVKLDGQWEFYYNQLLWPEDLGKAETLSSSYIDIPCSWNGYRVNDEASSGHGYATYRLLVVTEESGILGIKIPRIFTSYKLWVNSQLIASAGMVGESRDTMTAQYLPQVALFVPQPGENEIVIQVSNFYHRSGGILESLIIGSEEQMTGLRNKNIAYELFLFGSLMIIGLYHLALFFFRKKHTSPLYFGLFCLFVGIRTLLVGEIFFIYLFPAFNWEIAHKFQTLAFYLGVPLIVLFFRSVFPKYFHPKIVRIILVIGAAFGCLVIFTPVRIFSVFNSSYQIFVLVVISYVISVFIRMMIQKEKGIGIIIFGAMAMMLASLNDIVFLSIWMNDNGSTFLRTIFRTGNLSSVGQLVFILTNSFLMAKKFSNALEQEEVMTAQLKEINLNLDHLVIKRTEALEESTEKIEYQKQELEKANKALQLLSLKDPLTDLWNRRHYDDTILIEWNQRLRYKQSISLMLFDIDFFKEYNDFYGHQAGDACLVKIANATKDFFRRAGDKVFRYGGEEFIVIMSGLGRADAMKIAQSIRKAIEELKIPHCSSKISPWVTISIGVTSVIPNMDGSIEELFLMVDKALYQAKDAGRNQVKFIGYEES